MVDSQMNDEPRQPAPLAESPDQDAAVAEAGRHAEGPGNAGASTSEGSDGEQRQASCDEAAGAEVIKPPVASLERDSAYEKLEAKDEVSPFDEIEPLVDLGKVPEDLAASPRALAFARSLSFMREAEEASGDALGPLDPRPSHSRLKRSSSARGKLSTIRDPAPGSPTGSSPGSAPKRRMPTSLSRSSAPPDVSRLARDPLRRPSTLSLGRISIAPSAADSLPIVDSVRYVEHVPRAAVWAATVISINALVMAVAEILIEILIVAGVYPKLPFRLDFFFLTLLSALLGWQSLVATRNGHFDTSKNALQVAGLVELALIAGDILFIVTQQEKYPAALPTRVPFMVLTALNLVLVSYLYVAMHRFHKRELALEAKQAEDQHGANAV
mmetsp:Transcript_32603/g.81763  ORF Transcript_32603/g.81763 Transcript_32603/m.81763 type:complete len:384 (+) Transcript_32603:291-1442(+)